MSTQTITVKIHDAKKVISTFKVTKVTDQAVVIQAKNKVNYEFIDDVTQFAPENLKIQRVGNDLHIAFEDDDGQPEATDLIIENYYGHDGVSSNLLIGLSENGNYYAYVPESGLQAHAVSMLADQITAGQALGGNVLTQAAFEFNPWWLLALIPIAALAAGGGGGGGDNPVIIPKVTAIDVTNTNDVAIEGENLTYAVTLSEATQSTVTYTFALGGGTAVTADYGTPVFSGGVTYDAAQGTITVPAGVASFTVTVPTIDDALVELTETLNLTIAGVKATGTILDNDKPSITGIEVGAPGATDDMVTEGESLVYNVTLNVPSSTAQTYEFTLGGTATAADYGTLVFSSGVTYDAAQGTITVPAGVTSFTVSAASAIPIPAVCL